MELGKSYPTIDVCCKISYHSETVPSLKRHLNCIRSDDLLAKKGWSNRAQIYMDEVNLERKRVNWVER